MDLAQRVRSEQVQLIYRQAPPALAISVLVALLVAYVLWDLGDREMLLGWVGLLLGLSLVIAGCLEVALGWESGRRASAILLGAVLIVGGVLAAFWPEATVWTLAVLTGVSLLVHGLIRLGVAVIARAEIPGWGWLALAGAVNIVVGIIALVWPEATVVVLAVILGVQVLLFGVLVLVAAFAGSRSTTARVAA